MYRNRAYAYHTDRKIKAKLIMNVENMINNLRIPKECNEYRRDSMIDHETAVKLTLKVQAAVPIHTGIGTKRKY